MTTSRFGGRNGRSALSPTDAEAIDVSVDRWIARLEEHSPRRPSNRSLRPAPRSTTARATSRDRELSREPSDEALDEPQSMRHPRTSDAKEGEPADVEGGRSPGSTASPRVEGNVVNFSDSFGGTIVLHRSAVGLVHQGSIAVRSPGARLGELCARCGLTGAQALARVIAAPLRHRRLGSRPGRSLGHGRCLGRR